MPVDLSTIFKLVITGRRAGAAKFHLPRQQLLRLRQMFLQKGHAAGQFILREKEPRFRIARLSSNDGLRNRPVR